MFRLSGLFVTLSLLTGCATMFNPGPTSFTATSDPVGAVVEVEGIQNGETMSQSTPASFTLDKGSDYRLTFELDGYQSDVVTVRREVNGWFIGSILLGIVPGVVDFATNSMWNHTMTVAHVDFTEQADNGDMTGLARLGITDVEGATTFVTVPLRFQPL